jgi:hypothetical protein
MRYYADVHNNKGYESITKDEKDQIVQDVIGELNSIAIFGRIPRTKGFKEQSNGDAIDTTDTVVDSVDVSVA